MNVTPPPSSSTPQANDATAAAVVASYDALSRQQCRYLLRLREFDLHRGYRQQLKGGKRAANTPDWLRLVCGVERADAEDHLRLAYALLKVPEIECAFGSGRISYRKARALASVADAASERGLLDLGLVMTDGQVEEYCRRVRGGGYTCAKRSAKESASVSQDRITMYHNPACSKCRTALATLRGQGVEFDVVEYLQQPLGEERIARILECLEDPAADLVRKDGNFRALGLAAADYTSPAAVAKLLAEHPQLMQRPVLVRGERAVIARSPEKVEALL